MTHLLAPLPVAGAALALALSANSTVAAPLANGDFSTDFSGWLGQTIACSTCDGSDDDVVDLDPPTSTNANFALTAGAAILRTSFNDNGVYEISLRQQFDVDALTGRATGLALVLDLTYLLSDPTTDLVIAQLTDPTGTLATKDLLSGARLDITEYAGQTAELYFALTDFVDGDVDALSVDNIRIEQVPVPAPLALLGAGLGLLAGRRRLLAHQPVAQE